MLINLWTELDALRTQSGDGMLDFHTYLEIRHKQDDTVVSSTRRPHFIVKKIPWYLFLLGSW